MPVTKPSYKNIPLALQATGFLVRRTFVVLQ